jgi:hypothetical protein
MSSVVKSYEGMNGFSWWVFQIKHDAVDKIKRSGIPYLIFNPSTFMENYSEGGFISENKVMVVGKSKYPNWLISADDFAKMAVKAIESIGEDEDKEYIIQGPEGFTLDKAASLYASNYSHTGIKNVYYPLSILKFLGMFNRKFYYGSKILEAMNNYPETFQSENVWKELGTPKTSFIEFIQSRNVIKKELLER